MPVVYATPSIDLRTSVTERVGGMWICGFEELVLVSVLACRGA